MSIYEKDSYSQSKVVFLAGPIEYWWGERFMSPAAIAYREHRDMVAELLVKAGYLVYRPDRAFKGNWNERMQGVNDYVLSLVDAVVYMTPEGILALGTDHEVDYARSLSKPVFHCPPTTRHDSVAEPDCWNTVNRAGIYALISILEEELSA